MRLRDLTICFIGLIVAAGLLFLAEGRLDYINAKRLEWKLISSEPLRNAPPSLAFATIAMGAFRGLVVDILWIRADRLKEQGQFFDAKQLAEWITTLQPRFTEVWDFQAWNMAYNISVAVPATQPEQRWQWVKNGYQLLRDKAIPQNPRAINLYRALGWLFLHKIGGISDDCHKYYKLQLALAIRPLLEPATNDFFQILAEAPKTWDQLLQAPDVAQFVGELRNADSEFAEQAGFVSNYLSLRQNPARFKEAAFEVVNRYRGTEALRRFDFFARAYQLRNVWKLDPALMNRLNRTYGPVDWNDPNSHLPLNWEHPAAHAMYWAAIGLQLAGQEKFTVEELNTDRIVYQALQELLRSGKLTIYPLTTASLPTGADQQSAMRAAEAASQAQSAQPVAYTVFLWPDLRMFESCNQAYLAKIKKTEAHGAEAEGRAQSIKNAHRHMLLNSIALIYQAGHVQPAQKIYDQLRELYPRDEFKLPLPVFVMNQLHKELQDLGVRDASEMIMMLLRESYFRYALREDDEAFGREKMAEEVYRVKKEQTSDTERLQLPDLGMLRYLALMDFLNDEAYPLDLRQALRTRIRIERPALAEQLEQQEKALLQQTR